MEQTLSTLISSESANRVAADLKLTEDLNAEIASRIGQRCDFGFVRSLPAN
jgi:hypothetical protein